MKRNATAVWNGPGKDGNGTLTTQSTVLDHTKYSFNSRFGEEKGTNPEELLAASHAGCFTMKLSFVLGEAGFAPTQLETTAYVNFENGAVTGSHLVVKAQVPGISNDAFQKAVKEAEQNCPISRALGAIAISSEGTLQA
ncbi:osmotically inducible protein OsmC [Chitinophaga skermanii]|uniref:Osmotically inducible protein OsmC n=1 Tax=Chitinophaga skermanii TaxID=331697 RepID=A0A327QDI0_9BACT|nr:OsmC family protein [Chitinophaga skermanii]RAI99706.1 osmotically inducible protein OsmC [Chitinophaga skermanii]